jgi:hypothetical protein
MIVKYSKGSKQKQNKNWGERQKAKNKTLTEEETKPTVIRRKY